jgi:hypothetical protein
MFMPQPQYKKLKPLSKSDKAYIAGLIDGEGTITLTRIHRNEHRQLCISISSTGIGKVTNKRKSKPHHAQSFCYSVYNRQALGLLKEICADLKSYKRKRADLILETYLEVTPRNGKYNLDILKKKREFERKVMGLKPSG